MGLYERRLAVCKTCEQYSGGVCQLLHPEWQNAERMKSFLETKANHCHADRQAWAGDWIRNDPVLLAKDLYRCRWRSEGVRPEAGIVTGASSEVEWMLPWWLGHVRQHCQSPVAVGDLGLSDAALSWCQHRGLEVMNLRDPWAQNTLRSLRMPASAWFRKPLVILNAPFERIVWLDLDVEVRGSLSSLFDLCGPTRVVLHPHGWPITRSNWGKRRAGELMWQTGVVATCHGDRLIPAWARACAEMTQKPNWVRGDMQAFSRMCYDNEDWPRPLPIRFDAIRGLSDCPDAVVRHYPGRNKAHPRQAIGLPTAAVFRPDSETPEGIHVVVSRQLQRAGCTVKRVGRHEPLPTCDFALTWNGMFPHYLAFVRRATERDVPVYFMENGFLPQAHHVQIDTDGVNAKASWARASLSEADGQKVSVRRGDLLLTLQVEGDSQIKNLSPWLPSVAALVRHLAENSVVPVCVRAHPKQEPSENLRRIVNESARLRWDRLRPLRESLRCCAALATINSTCGIEAMSKGIPVLCYGESLYRHFPAAYCMTGDPGQTRAVTAELAAGQCSLFRNSQQEIVSRCLAHQTHRDHVGEWIMKHRNQWVWNHV